MLYVLEPPAVAPVIPAAYGFALTMLALSVGLNGFGKSSLVRRIVIGGIAQQITPLILAGSTSGRRHISLPTLSALPGDWSPIPGAFP